jgi:hypothetical protein
LVQSGGKANAVDSSVEHVVPRANRERPNENARKDDLTWAQDLDSDEGWHVGFTPYIWFAGIHGTVGALNHDASVHATFGDIFNYLNIGLMGVVEPRYNRIVMPVDFKWMKLSDNKALPFDEGATSVKAKMTETLLTPKIGYRFDPTRRLGKPICDLCRLQRKVGPQMPIAEPEKRIHFHFLRIHDGLGGGRIELGLTPKLSAIVGGDAGGGSAKLDYQVAAILGYKLNRKLVLLVGYRYLAVDYRASGRAGFLYDVAMPGLGLGLTINLK